MAKAIAYVCSVRGPIPHDLAERISQWHADAILAAEQAAGAAVEVGDAQAPADDQALTPASRA